MLDKKDLKIALASLQEDAERIPPLGLVYLATYLSEKVGLEKKNIRIFDKNYSTLDDMHKEIAKFRPHIVGLTAMAVNYTDAIKFASRIKNRLNILTLIGGVHISTLPESLKKCFDVGVLGEGEETLKELISLFLKKQKFNVSDLRKIKSIAFYDKDKNGKEKIKITKTRDPIELDTLPLPDFKFANKNYFKEQEIPGIGRTGIKCYLISSRGCPYRCVFCSTARFWGKMRLHSPEYTAQAVEKEIKELGADFVDVLDDLFTISPDRVLAIKKEFDKRGILQKIKGIDCTVRANLVNDKLCQAMKQIKIKIINFGFESGSERMLKYLKAGSVSVEMNKRAILLCKKYGFNIYGSLMYGSPTETLEDMKKTNDFIDFCLRHKASNIWSFVATPFPATPFCRKTVSNDMNFDLLDHHNQTKPLLLDPNIDLEEFQKVFLQGRKKLRKFKIRLIENFIFKNPIGAITMVAKEPQYYISRIFKQVLSQ